jgi:hypothetical protein
VVVTALAVIKEAEHLQAGRAKAISGTQETHSDLRGAGSLKAILEIPETGDSATLEMHLVKGKIELLQVDLVKPILEVRETHSGTPGNLLVTKEAERLLAGLVKAILERREILSGVPGNHSVTEEAEHLQAGLVKEISETREIPSGAPGNHSVTEEAEHLQAGLVKKILEIREILSGTLGFPKTLTVNLPQATAGIIIGMVTAMAQAAQSLIAKEMMTTTTNLHRVGAIPGVHISQLQRMGEAEERLTEGGEVEEVEEVCLDIDPSKEQKVKRNGSSW